MRSDQSLLEEAGRQLSLAWPVVLSFILRKSTDIVSVIFVGHLGANYLAAAGLAAVTANVSGNSMALGLAGAVSTIASQSFGAKDYKAFNAVLFRSITILLTCICIPMSILWFNSEKVMIFLGQKGELAKNAGQYLTMLIPNLWLLSCSVCIQFWLYAQSKTRAVTIVSAMCAILHPLWCYLFVYYFGFGFIGAAMSVVTTKALELTSFVLYIRVFSTILSDVNFSFSLQECFQNWWSYLLLGFPNLLMMTEWWASEVIIFMSGSLPQPDIQVSTMAIYQNTLSIAFMIPSGIGVAGCTRVGNLLGEGNPKLASIAARVSPIMACLFSIFLAILMKLFHHQWGTLFTNDHDVLKDLDRVLPMLVFYIVGDGIQAAYTGIIKGMGKQKIGGPIVLVSYYVFGLPVSIYSAFQWGMGWGIVGLCLGTTVGTWIHALLYFLVVYWTNWTEQCDIARKNIEKAHSGTIDISSSKAYSKSSVVQSYWKDFYKKISPMQIQSQRVQYEMVATGAEDLESELE